MHQINPIKRERATAVAVDICHTKLIFQGERKYLGPSLVKFKTVHVAKNSISLYFGQNSEMQNCQDYTDPTVHYFIELIF